MRAVGFDYGNTCPQIDRAISSAKAEIEAFLDRFLEDAHPFLDAKSRAEIALDYAEQLYANLEGIFEIPRSENEKMRLEADRQIRDLKDDIASLEIAISNLENELNQVQA